MSTHPSNQDADEVSLPRSTHVKESPLARGGKKALKVAGQISLDLGNKISHALHEKIRPRTPEEKKALREELKQKRADRLEQARFERELIEQEARINQLRRSDRLEAARAEAIIHKTQNNSSSRQNGNIVSNTDDDFTPLKYDELQRVAKKRGLY